MDFSNYFLKTTYFYGLPCNTRYVFMDVYNVYEINNLNIEDVTTEKAFETV